MANSSRRNKDRDVKDAPADASNELVVEDVVAKEAVVPAVVAEPAPSKLSARVRKTMESAIKDGTVRIKSESDFRAAKEALKANNPLKIKVEWKPGLGHHSVAVG